MKLNSGFYSQDSEHTCFVLKDDTFQKQFEFWVKILYQWTGNRVAYVLSCFLSHIWTLLFKTLLSNTEILQFIRTLLRNE